MPSAAKGVPTGRAGGAASSPSHAADQLLTLREVSVRIRRNPELLRRWCASGRIRCRRLGRDWLIDASDLEVIEALPRRGTTPRSGIAVDDVDVLDEALRAEVEASLERAAAASTELRSLADAADVEEGAA